MSKFTASYRGIHSSLLGLLFSHVMINTSVEQKVYRKHANFMYKPIREQHAFYVTQTPPILRLAHLEYFFLKLSDTTLLNYSKQAVMTALNYIRTAHSGVRVFVQLSQCYVFIRHLDDI